MLRISEFSGETAARWFQAKDHPNCSSIIALNSLDLEIIQQNIFEGVTKYNNLMICKGRRRRHSFKLKEKLYLQPRCLIYSFKSLFLVSRLLSQIGANIDWYPICWMFDHIESSNLSGLKVNSKFLHWQRRPNQSDSIFLFRREVKFELKKVLKCECQMNWNWRRFPCRAHI